MVWVRQNPPGGHPYYGRGSTSIACPICDAVIGVRCVVWRKWGGERDSVIRYMRKPHAERTRLWRQTLSPDSVSTVEMPPRG